MIYGLILLGIIITWTISVYNFFVSSRTRIKASIQEIGNQLKRQIDLIPNLESSAKGYLKHEKGIFENLTDARKQISEASKSGNIGKMAEAGEMFSKILPKIQVLVEDNPELKGNEVVGNLMNELRDTQDKIMYARRLLIDLTADFNVKRVTFPSSLVANLFKISEEEGLKLPENIETPKINI